MSPLPCSGYSHGSALVVKSVARASHLEAHTGSEHPSERTAEVVRTADECDRVGMAVGDVLNVQEQVGSEILLAQMICERHILGELAGDAVNVCGQSRSHGCGTSGG